MKENNVKKESKFYVINFMDPRIIFFTKKILTPGAMKTYIQKSYKESKWEGRKMCARTVNGSEQISY